MAAAAPPPIGGHRLVSCGASAALVRPTGEVDWWCAPAFDSPPVLWSLLDPAGAAARWRGTRPVSVGEHPAGPSAATRVKVAGGRVDLRDGVVSIGAATALVRLVRAVDGPAAMVHEVAVGGFDGPPAEPVVVGPPGRVQDGMVVTEVTAGPDWTGFAVVIGDNAGRTLDEWVAALEESERAFTERLANVKLPRSHPARATQAIAVLHACTFAETGAVIASATTSLPEVPGGDRQFDYRYSWLRDAGLAAAVASTLGDRRTAERYLDFVCRVVEKCGLWAPVVTVRGDDLPEEREVGDASGWAGSRPVRVGNAASAQRQYDALGMVVEALHSTLRAGGRLTRRRWALVRRIADALADEPPDRPSNGIWERREPALMTSADVGRWLALDRALRIARRRRPWTRRRRWVEAREAAKARVLAHLGEDGSLPMTYDGPFRADAAALMVPLFGMLSGKDPRAHKLVDKVLADLGAWPFVYRYEPDGRDGFAPGEGAFLPTSFWAVSALAAIGRVGEARERLDALCRVLPDLIAEEIDPESGASLGNTPLVWAHMELARAIEAVDRSARWWR